MVKADHEAAQRQLILGTGAFALCFAVFGSLSAMMPVLSRQLHMSAMEKSLAIAVPVLLGSVGRIPLGILTDRRGGRGVFIVVMAVTMAAAFLMGTARGYGQLIGYGFMLGLGLASFSVGVGFVSSWYASAQQGTALGIYGAGNIGQSLAAFGAPLIAAAAGVRWGFWVFGMLLAVWLIIFSVFARNAPRPAHQRPWRETLQPLGKRQTWVLSLYYFLTFGGFVTMSLYLPILLTETYHLSPAAAGYRTAGFIVLATAARPVGGILADKIGGREILRWVFVATAFFTIFLDNPQIIVFRIGALGIAAAIGLGNGAVFKLVPEHFPKAVGSVTGIVGAAGGLGGFFPPLLLGWIREQTGAYFLGFVLLGFFALGCLAVLMRSTSTQYAVPVPQPD